MIEKFIADTEKLLHHISRVEEGNLACIETAARLAKEQGLGASHLQEAVLIGVEKKAASFLQRIREGEDIELYATLLEELVEKYGLDRAEIEEKKGEAVREAELRTFNHYVNMIENENIHLISKAKAIQKRYGLESRALEEAIDRGEYAYLLNNIKQIKRGPDSHPLLPREEKVLRSLAGKYGHEEELEAAIARWKVLSCRSER